VPVGRGAGERQLLTVEISMLVSGRPY